METFDAIVVGSGPIGISVARRLAEFGRRVMVFEAGRAVTTPPGSHLRNTAPLADDADGYVTAISPYLRPVPGNLPGANESALVGGQGILWTNNCPRMAEFERFGAMNADEWERWYGEAEAMLQVRQSAWPSGISRRIQECLEAYLRETGRSIGELPFAGRIEGEKIHYVGPADILASAPADVRERIALRADSTVTNLRMASGRVQSVDVETDGRTEQLEAAVFVVAGGAVATARLLWRSGIRPAALGRGNSFHALLLGQVVLNEKVCGNVLDPFRGPRLVVPPTRERPWQVMLLRDICPLASSESVAARRKLMEFQAFVPVEFSEQNALVLAGGGRDEFQFQFSPIDLERMAAMRADVENMASFLGRWRRGCEPVWIPHGNSHIVGTCRMDLPGWQGVADEFGRVHGVENLFLASVGLISAPMAENPTLTGVALGLRMCEHAKG